MKKIIVVMISLVGFIFSINAQDFSKKKIHHQPNRSAMMLNELNLTTAQKEQMKANQESYKKQMIELNKNVNITVKESRDRKEALHKEQKEKMMNLLTADQKNKLAQLKKDREAKHEMEAAKRLDKMKTNLNLSDDQVAKINAARQATQAQLKAIKENDQLSRTEKREQLIALKEQNKDSFKNILTPEQISKLEEMKKIRMDKKSRI
jgi:Spy/CpxP family protein refolding chaperone